LLANGFSRLNADDIDAIAAATGAGESNGKRAGEVIAHFPRAGLHVIPA
jgi:hypothetical protein